MCVWFAIRMYTLSRHQSVEIESITSKCLQIMNIVCLSAIHCFIHSVESETNSKGWNKHEGLILDPKWLLIHESGSDLTWSCPVGTRLAQTAGTGAYESLKIKKNCSDLEIMELKHASKWIICFCIRDRFHLTLSSTYQTRTGCMHWKQWRLPNPSQCQFPSQRHSCTHKQQVVRHWNWWKSIKI
jgi:hypothetical protein